VERERPVLRDEPELERELRDEFDGVSAARSLSKSLSA
jgi:hypothetical protein